MNPESLSDLEELLRRSEPAPQLAPERRLQTLLAARRVRQRHAVIRRGLTCGALLLAAIVGFDWLERPSVETPAMEPQAGVGHWDALWSRSGRATDAREESDHRFGLVLIAGDQESLHNPGGSEAASPIEWAAVEERLRLRELQLMLLRNAL